jgi:hypothetical protein
MTPAQASTIIGCTTRHVRYLIQQGRLKATHKWIVEGQHDRRVRRWNITRKEAERFVTQKRKGT